jgi:hypothetical protein
LIHPWEGDPTQYQFGSGHGRRRRFGVHPGGAGALLQVPGAAGSSSTYHEGGPVNNTRTRPPVAPLSASVTPGPARGQTQQPAPSPERQAHVTFNQNPALDRVPAVPNATGVGPVRNQQQSAYFLPPTGYTTPPTPAPPNPSAISTGQFPRTRPPPPPGTRSYGYGAAPTPPQPPVAPYGPPQLPPSTGAGYAPMPAPPAPGYHPAPQLYAGQYPGAPMNQSPQPSTNPVPPAPPGVQASGTQGTPSASSSP